VKGIKAVIFDFDGVLVESVDIKTKAFAKMYQQYGSEIEKSVIDFHLAHGGVSRNEKLRYYEERLLGRHLSLEKENLLAKTFSDMVKTDVIKAPFVPGAEQFLLSYHQRLALFVVSGTPHEELYDILAKRDMLKYFLSVYGAPYRKFEAIENILMLYGFDGQSVVMVGDSRTDYEEAMIAGINFIGRSSTNNFAFPPDIKTIPDLTILHLYLQNQE